MTVLTGPERRRRWDDDVRERILAEAFSPGATVSDVARRFQVSTSLIYKWRRASLVPPAPMGFAPAVLIEGVGRSAAEGSGFAIVVDLPGGARVSLAANAPSVLVTATLKGCGDPRPRERPGLDRHRPYRYAPWHDGACAAGAGNPQTRSACG